MTADVGMACATSAPFRGGSAGQGSRVRAVVLELPGCRESGSGCVVSAREADRITSQNRDDLRSFATRSADRHGCTVPVLPKPSADRPGRCAGSTQPIRPKNYTPSLGTSAPARGSWRFNWPTGPTEAPPRTTMYQRGARAVSHLDLIGLSGHQLSHISGQASWPPRSVPHRRHRARRRNLVLLHHIGFGVEFTPWNAGCSYLANLAALTRRRMGSNKASYRRNSGGRGAWGQRC